ncbi:hypothetical protein FEI15_11095 [Lacticaseibacillus zeae]|uniref:Uncharacterized protein n=1 Tax=Lacticaseibacillus zeae TaxID=57037 RepID=A0A5R8LM12_LACZE|nr:hypothetical protein FEI15_11095 [Lacticaseibacillus zeae]
MKCVLANRNWRFPQTHSLAQKSAYKNLGRNGQRPARLPMLSETRSPAQKSAYKDLGRDGLSPGHHAQGHLYSDF